MGCGCGGCGTKKPTTGGKDTKKDEKKGDK
jgi:hypothetical protein